MNQEIEIEFKNLLLKSEFDRLADAFSISGEEYIRQENHYFDTHSFDLKEKNSALRIRQKNGVYVLTLKQPAQEGLLETNHPLTREEAHNMLDGLPMPKGMIYDILAETGILPESVQLFGTLSTERAERVYKSGLLVLDHSFYLNQEDYEVEYEVSDKMVGQVIFSQLLKSLKIPYRTTENKVRRFYRAKFNS
ncbi:CYTH domain-containing protein [Peribacillus sp. SCS-155]|uniref:CYTH domain-containing protein n=1 Tax=Peribacillus sedimenti TaxID=3115297 RepID=UPI0039065AF2